MTQAVQQPQGDNQPVDFNALTAYYSGQIAGLHERVALLVGQLSAAVQDKGGLEKEIEHLHQQFHNLTQMSGDEFADWQKQNSRDEGVVVDLPR